MDQVIAWRVPESFTDIDIKSLDNLYLKSEAMRCLLQDAADPNNSNHEGYAKSLFNHLSGFYHKLEHKFSVNPETRTLTGPVDTTVKYVELSNVRNLITIGEVKSSGGDSWYQLMTQARRYCYSIYLDKSVFVNLLRGTKISFFIYQPRFHESLYFWIKPDCFKNFLGLVLNKDTIEVLPQKNSYYPQMYLYDLADFSDENIKGIHHIFEFQAQYTTPPTVYYDHVNNKLEIVGGVKRDIESTSS